MYDLYSNFRHLKPIICSNTNNRTITNSIKMKTHTDLIFEDNGYHNNSFQGYAPKYLFVCSAGMLRSPTAAKIATLEGYNARACGSDLSCALIPISVNLILWANKIFFINKENYTESLANFFGDVETCANIKEKAVIWDIKDNYAYDDFILKQRIIELLKN